MNNPRWTARLKEAAFWRPVAGVVAMVLLLAYFHTLTLYIVISLVITTVGRPLHDWLIQLRLGRLKMSSSVAAVVTLVSFLSVLLALAALLVPLILTEIELLSQIDPAKLVEQAREPLDRYSEMLRRYGMDVNLNESIRKWLRETFNSLFLDLRASDFLSIFSTIGDVIALIFSVSFISFFLLQDRSLLTAAFTLLTPPSVQIRIKRIMIGARPLLRRYFMGLLIQICFLTAGYFLGFWLVGLDHAFLIALLAGLFNVVPYIGPLIGFLLALVVSISTGMDHMEDMTQNLLWIAGAYVLVQVIDNNILQPVIFSSSVKAHPLEIFFAILMGAQLGGVGGMILAIPAYTVLRVIAREFFADHPIVKRLTGHL